MASSLAITIVSFLTVVTAAPYLPLHTPVAANSGQQYVLVSAPVLRTQYHAQDGLGQYAYGYSNGDGHYKAESKFLDGTVVGQYGYDLPGSKHVHVTYKAVDETPKVVVVQPVALGTVVTGETKSAASVYSAQDKGRVVDAYKQAIIVTDPVVPVPVVAQTRSNVATGSNYASEDVLVQEEAGDRNLAVNQYGADSEMPMEEDQSYRQPAARPSVAASYNAQGDEIVEEKSSYQASQSASSASKYASSQDYNAPVDAYDYPPSGSSPTGGAAISSASAYAPDTPDVPYGVSGGVSASASSSGSSYASSGGGASVLSSVPAPVSGYAPAGVPAGVPSGAYATGNAGLPTSSVDASADDAASYANAIDSNRRLTYAGTQEQEDSSYYADAQSTSSASGYGSQSIIRPVPLTPDNLEIEDEPSYRPQNTASVRVHQSVPANENSYRLNAPVPSFPQTQIQQSYYSEAASKASANQSSVVTPIVAGGIPSVQVVASVPGVQAVAAVPAVAVVHQPQPPVAHIAVPVVPAPAVPVVSAPAVSVVTGSPIPVVPVVHVKPGHTVTHTQESHSNHSSSSSSHSYTSRVSQGGVPLHVVVPNVQITKESSQHQQSSQSHSSNKVSVKVVQSASPAPVLASANVVAAPVVLPIQTSIHIPVVSPVLRKIVPVSSPPPNYENQAPQQRPSYGAEETVAEDYAPVQAPARNKY